MKQKHGFFLLIPVIFFSVTLSVLAEKINPELWKKTLEIHNSAIVMDAHAHPLIYLYASPENLDLGKKTGKSHVDFLTMKEGGLDAVFLSVPLVDERDRENPAKKIFNDIRLIRKNVEKYSHLAEVAVTPGDIRRIHQSGKRAVLFGIEARDYLKGHTGLIEAYYKAGVRYMTMAHSKVDRLADSDANWPAQSGLSQFGKKVVKEMNRLGMMIDITHVPDKLQLDIIKQSRAPVLATHSCVRAVHDTQRNIPDEILKALAKKGGAVMIPFYSGHISADYTAKLKIANKKIEEEKKKLEIKLKDNKAELDKQIKALEKKLSPGRVNVELLIDHIDHAVKVAGIDHVGLGSDFVGVRPPVGLEDASGFPLITYHLLKRGYKEDDIKKILGGNLLRVFKEAQKLIPTIR